MPEIPDSVKQARERFTRQFKRAVLERIERQTQERMERSPGEMNAERDALIKTFSAAGQTVRQLADAFHVTVRHVRRLVGDERKAKPQKPARPVQLERLPLEGLRHAA